MPLAYNGLLGRPWLFETGAVTSVRYLTIKIPTSNGVVTIHGNQDASRECYKVASLSESKGEAFHIDDSEVHKVDTEKKAEPVGDLNKVRLGNHKEVKLGTEMNIDLHLKVRDVLERNASSFATHPKGIQGIHPSDACHRLNVYKDAKPVK